EGAVKWMNEASSTGYIAAIDRRRAACARSFSYEPVDLRLLHVTRSLSALAVDRARYRVCFGTDIVHDFTDVVEAVAECGLVDVGPQSLALTPRGMFFADAVAGLFASRRAVELRSANDSRAAPMG